MGRGQGGVFLYSNSYLAKFLREVYYKTIIIFLYYRVASEIKQRVFSGSPPSKHFYFILKSQFELVLILFLTCNSSVFNC